MLRVLETDLPKLIGDFSSNCTHLHMFINSDQMILTKVFKKIATFCCDLVRFAENMYIKIITWTPKAKSMHTLTCDIVGCCFVYV
jgi:hypothetical protein